MEGTGFSLRVGGSTDCDARGFRGQCSLVHRAPYCGSFSAHLFRKFPFISGLRKVFVLLLSPFTVPVSCTVMGLTGLIHPVVPRPTYSWYCPPS